MNQSQSFREVRPPKILCSEFNLPAWPVAQLFTKDLAFLNAPAEMLSDVTGSPDKKRFYGVNSQLKNKRCSSKWTNAGWTLTYSIFNSFISSWIFQSWTRLSLLCLDVCVWIMLMTHYLSRFVAAPINNNVGLLDPEKIWQDFRYIYWMLDVHGDQRKNPDAKSIFVIKYFCISTSIGSEINLYRRNINFHDLQRKNPLYFGLFRVSCRLYCCATFGTWVLFYIVLGHLLCLPN